MTFINFVTFRDGQSRAGVYCAANACIEQVIQHGEVDVFQAVKTVRRHRPQVVENIVSLYILECFLICRMLNMVQIIANDYSLNINSLFF